MKKVFLITTALLFTISSFGQYVLEQTYDSASTYNTCANNLSQLMIIKFENSGEHYVRINTCGKLMSIYTLNHVLVKNISLQGLLLSSTNQLGDLLYISENLFDTDSGIEFMYVTRQNSFYNTRIYDEDGTIIFSDNGAPIIKVNFHLQQFPIYNTSVGTKMMLSYENGQVKVYGLPGKLTTEIKNSTNNLLNQDGLITNLYPNPVINTSRVDYELPEGIHQADLVFYNSNGNEVKRFKVDRTFNHILVSSQDLDPGTYFYQLQTSTRHSESKKVIVIQ